MNTRAEDNKDFLSRCKLIEGDFFKSIPIGADGFIIKNVILNWDDDSAPTILKNCLQAMEKTVATMNASQGDKQKKIQPKLLIIDLIMQKETNRLLVNS